MKQNSAIKELRRIAKENGGVLLPSAVVEAARPKSSPIHSRFEWDDGVAAEQYRLCQARQLIRVSVECIEGVGDPVDVFVSLGSDRVKDGGGYRLVVDVLNDEEMCARMLQDAKSEMEVFRRKYSRLKQLSGVFSAMEAVE